MMEQGLTSIGIGLTGPLEKLMKRAMSSSDVPMDQRSVLAEDLENNQISSRGLSILAGIQEDTDENSRVIFDACRGSKLLFPRHKARSTQQKAEPSSEYTTRKATLIRRQEEREYNQMIYGSDSPPGNEEGVKKQIAAVQDQAAIGLNVVVSTAASFGIGYYFAGYYNPSSTFCMVAGTAVATIVLVMELVLFIVRALRVS